MAHMYNVVIVIILVKHAQVSMINVSPVQLNLIEHFSLINVHVILGSMIMALPNVDHVARIWAIATSAPTIPSASHATPITIL